MNSANKERDARADRLRSALRENLKRRKAQAKRRGQSGESTSQAGDAAQAIDGKTNSSRISAGIAPDKPKD
jgi:hypothetical protein